MGESLLGTVRGLAAQVAPRSEEIEALRRLPADLAGQLAEAGLFRMFVPAVYGGLELPPSQIIEIIEVLARADGSTAWCLTVGAGTGIAAGWLPDGVARRIYGPPAAVTGGAVAPMGRAEQVAGGYRLTGRWPWVSGGHHCQWLVGGAVITKDAQPVHTADRIQTRMLIFPREEVVLHDTWHAVGLRGTGSGDMQVQDLFVPAEHSFSLATEPPRVSSPLHALGPVGLLVMGIPAVALGIARRAIDELTALAARKPASPGGPPMASRAAVQADVAEAEALVRSARAYLLAAIDDSYSGADSDREPVLRRAALRLAFTHVTHTAARAVDLMYQAAGGTSVYDSSPLQRCFRDVHVATQHARVARPTMELVGQALLGLDPDPAAL